MIDQYDLDADAMAEGFESHEDLQQFLREKRQEEAEDLADYRDER